MEHRPDLQFDDQASQEPWPIELDYGDAEEEEYEEEASSASFGSLMSMSMGKPKKRPVLEVDPEELAKASHQFELSGAKILDNTEERPAPAYGKISLDPFDGTEPDFDLEDEEAFEEELATGTIEPDADELRPETAERLNAMLGLGAESVTEDYDDESNAVLPSLTGTSAKTGKKPLFVHTDDGVSGGNADDGVPAFEEAAQSPEWEDSAPVVEEAGYLPEWEDPADDAVHASFDQPAEPGAEFEGPVYEEPRHGEPASPAGSWDLPEEEFAEPQWPDLPAWPDLYSDEEEDNEAEPVETVPESAQYTEPEPATVAEPVPEEIVEVATSPEVSPNAIVLRVEEFEEETTDFMAPAVPKDRQVLARMEGPASHSRVRARLVREAKPRKTLWQHCWAAAVSLYRLFSGRR